MRNVGRHVHMMPVDSSTADHMKVFEKFQVMSPLSKTIIDVRRRVRLAAQSLSGAKRQC